MTDLQNILPGFPNNNITRVLERNLITTTDLLVCDAVEIAKRTGLGVLDIRRFTEEISAALKFGELEENDVNTADRDVEEGSGLQRGPEEKMGNDGAQISKMKKQGSQRGKRKLVRTGEELVSEWKMISTLDAGIDAALGGGIPAGYITEITGESGAGKTQFLLSLLLSAQLPPPHGLSRPTLYISTESALPTTRLQQILSSNPLFSSQQHPHTNQNFAVSLDHIHSIVTPDLESQDHILRFQVPVFVARHNIGLIVLDSVAANYRAEFERGAGGGSLSGGANMAKRSGELIKLGELFREIAGREGCAVVVANQVADRFTSPGFNSGLGMKRKREDSGDGREWGTTQGKSLAYRHGDNVGGTPMPNPTSVIPGVEPPSSMVAAAELGLPHPGLPPPHPPPAPPTTKPHPPPNPPQNQISPPNPNPNITSTLANRDIMTLDHQQRFFTGWGDTHPHSAPEIDKNGDLLFPAESLKTPSLGLVWSTQIACRVVLKKRPVYARAGDMVGHTNMQKDSRNSVGVVTGDRGTRDLGGGGGGGIRREVGNGTVMVTGTGTREGEKQAGVERERERDEGDIDPNERILKGWRRWLRLVFAPWSGGGGEVEYVIRGEGIKSVMNREEG